jgi:hypothetical protein
MRLRSRWLLCDKRDGVLGDVLVIAFARKIYNVISQGTGLGITKNIIDCSSMERVCADCIAENQRK